MSFAEKDGVIYLNLNNMPVTVGTLAQIGTLLEMGKCVHVHGAALPENGPGLVAFELGIALQKAEDAKQ